MLLTKLFKSFKQWRWVFRSLPQTIYFNFHYLPFSQAKKLPILLYKPKLKALKGTVRIDGDVRFGMIQLGRNIVPLYPDSGFMFENNGGSLLFKGKCSLGSASAMSIGEFGKVEIGNDFVATTMMRMVAYHSVKIGEKSRFAWEIIVMDTDLHSLKKVSGGHSRGVGSVEIGNRCWIASRNVLLKGTVLPDFTTVQAQSVINRSFADIPPYSIIGSNAEVKVKATGLYRDVDDDVIDFSKV